MIFFTIALRLGFYIVKFFTNGKRIRIYIYIVIIFTIRFGLNFLYCDFFHNAVGLRRGSFIHHNKKKRLSDYFHNLSQITLGHMFYLSGEGWRSGGEALRRGGDQEGGAEDWREGMLEGRGIHNTAEGGAEVWRGGAGICDFFHDVKNICSKLSIVIFFTNPRL